MTQDIKYPEECQCEYTERLCCLDADEKSAREVESLKTQIRLLADNINCLQDRYRHLTGRFYSGGA